MSIFAPTVNGLRVRSILGRKQWGTPTPFGVDGWRLRKLDGTASVLVSAAEFDGAHWTPEEIEKAWAEWR